MTDVLFRLPVPGHEFVPSGCWPVACYFGDDIGDIGLRFDAVEFAGFDDRVDGSGAFTACFGSSEQPVFAADGDGAHRALGDIVVDLGAAVVDVAGERIPSLAAISQRLGHSRFGRQAAQGIVDGRAQFIDFGFAMFLSVLPPDIGRLPANLGLYPVKRCDPVQQLRGQRGRAGLVVLEDLTPEVSPSGHFFDVAIVIQLLISCIAISLQKTGEGF